MINVLVRFVLPEFLLLWLFFYAWRLLNINSDLGLAVGAVLVLICWIFQVWLAVRAYEAWKASKRKKEEYEHLLKGKPSVVCETCGRTGKGSYIATSYNAFKCAKCFYETKGGKNAVPNKQDG